MIIEGLDKIIHLMKSVLPGWRFSHREPRSRSNLIKAVASHAVSQPGGGTLPYTWLRRITKPISPVATRDES